MDLRAAVTNRRVFALSGWNSISEVWVPLSQRGNLSSIGPVPATDEAVKQRALSCPAADRLPSIYRLIFVDDTSYMLESEQRNSWKGGVYQYVYQLRQADKLIEIYGYRTTTMASGLPGKAVRTRLSGVNGGLVFANVLDVQSTAIEEVSYSRARAYLPGDVEVTSDHELVVEGDLYNILSVRTAQLVKVIDCVRRGPYVAST